MTLAKNQVTVIQGWHRGPWKTQKHSFGNPIEKTEFQ